MATLKTHALAVALAATLGSTALAASSPEKILNLYSSRHYQTDDALYANFMKQTGIKLNRIEAGDDPLIERLKNEGTGSPGDVLVTVDAGRLWRARPDMKVLFMSGHAGDPARLQDVLDAGAAFYPKPVVPATLQRKVREVLDA